MTNQKEFFENWVQQETWFMRAVGAALLLMAVASIPLDFTAGAEQGIGQALGMVVSVLMLVLGLWSLWYSTDQDRIETVIEQATESDGTRTIAAIVGLVLFGALFFLDALQNGRGTLLLVSLFMFVTAGWYGWRLWKIRQYSDLSAG